MEPNKDEFYFGSKRNRVLQLLKFVCFYFISFVKSIYFNFRFLPFGQAIRLPIYLYKPKFMVLKGKVIIDCPVIKTGMIKLGVYNDRCYPDCGIQLSLSNNASIVFKGCALIGSASYLDIYNKYRGGVKLVIGNDVLLNSGLKMYCYNNIEIGSFTRIGPGCNIMDSPQHLVADLETMKVSPMIGKVVIGDYVWLAQKCCIMPNTVVPSRLIFASNSLLNKDYSFVPKYSLLAGMPAKVKKAGVVRQDINPIFGPLCLADVEMHRIDYKENN